MFTLSRPSVPYSLSFRHSSSHFCRSTNCKIKVQTSGQARTAFAGCHPAARRLLPPPMSTVPAGTDPLPSPIPPNDVSNIITETLFEEMLPHRNNPRCPGIGFYTYDAFVAAARRFPGFGTTGNIETRKRELAAFFAQTSHETSGGWKDITGDEFARGYCHIREIDPPSDYCRPSEKWPCISGQRYYGRGPIQLTHNFNYGAAGEALGLDLLSNPDLVATNAALSFEAAIWFWMTPQYEKPSCHDVIIGVWTPTEADIAANRLPGYGLITNIINGGECGRGVDKRVARRIGFFERYCGMLGVSTGDNLDCYNQCSF